MNAVFKQLLQHCLGSARWREAASPHAVSALGACPVKNVLRSEKLGVEEPSWKAVVFSLTVIAQSKRV